MAAEGCLLGMGNPLLDISAVVKDELLTKYDLPKNLALLAEEKHLPIYDEMIKDYTVEYIAGGATQNSIRVAQWMMDVKGASSYFGCVGKDSFADKLNASAKEANVNAMYMEDETTATGTCAVLITGSERTLCANISAANNFKPSHLEKADVWAVVEKAKFYYVSGFFLTVSVESILKVAEHAAAENKVMMMNLAAPFISQVPIFKDRLMQTAPFWDIIFGNETEAEAFSEAAGFETKDLKEIALKLSQMPKKNSARPRIAIITHGSKSTTVAVDGKVTEYSVDTVAEADIVDTNGAGDAFVGGYIAQLAAGASIEASVKAGHWAAAVVIKQSGCTFPAKCAYTA